MNFIGSHRIKLSEIDSTNSELKVRAKSSSLPEGTLLHADCQPKGRGQRGEHWESADYKNFTGTFYLKPKLEGSSAFALNIIASLAARETVSDYGIENVKIKWPNDILINGKKVAGILVENALKGNLIEECYIGFGININQLAFSNFKREATSLAIELNREVGIEEFVTKLSIHLQQFYMLFKTKGMQPLKYLYLTELYLRNEWSDFAVPELIKGKIIGVTPEGFLSLETEQGQLKKFDLKEIRFTS